MATTLFPPILDSWMPAFVVSEGVNVTYTDPPYNEAVNKIEYRISLINSNKIIEEAIQDISAERYIKIISPKMEAGQIYKIQLRYRQGNSVSEWSRVCLLKPITLPRLETLDWKTGEIVNKITTDVPVIQATLTGNSQEVIKSYVIRLINADGTEMYNSGARAPESKNQICFTIPKKLTYGIHYVCEISYVTENGYSDYERYTLIAITDASTDIKGTITAVELPEVGGIKVTCTLTKPEDIDFKSIIVTRSSSEDNFLTWEDLYIVPGSISTEVVDYTVKSGVYYKYGFQSYSSSNQSRSQMITTSAIMIRLEYSYLVNEDMQLNIKFSDEVSTLKHTVAENKIETIGSRFPFIRRNAEINYKQFSLSGLISWTSDIAGDFIGENDIYKNPSLYYEEDENGILYNPRMGKGGIVDSIGRGPESLAYDLDSAEIIDYYDYDYEREYREKVMEFLYSEKAKLFRSSTEGNIIVKLMDISLTPKRELHRLTYSFSCTALEIAEPTMDNYKKYHIINFNEDLLISGTQKFDVLPLGQVWLKSKELLTTPGSSVSNDIIANELSNKHMSFYPGNNIRTRVRSLGYLKLVFFGEPQCFNGIDGYKFIADGREIIVRGQQTFLTSVNEALNQVNVVPGVKQDAEGACPNWEHMGMYVFEGDDVKIHTLSFDTAADYEVFVEYSAELESNRTVDPLSGEDPNYTYETRIVEGQIIKDFAKDESIYYSILNKLEYNHISNPDSIRQAFCRLVSIDAIHIETDPWAYPAETALASWEELGPKLVYTLSNGTAVLDTILRGYYIIEEDGEIINEVTFDQDTYATINFVAEVVIGVKKHK